MSFRSQVKTLIYLSYTFLPSRWEKERYGCISAKHLQTGLQARIKIFVCISKVPWLFPDLNLGRNQVLGKNGGNGFRCFCQDQYFSTMFIYKLFNLLWHIQGVKERFVRSTDANWQFWGWRREDQGPGEMSGTGWRGREACPPVHFLCTGLQPHRTTQHA